MYQHWSTHHSSLQQTVRKQKLNSNEASKESEEISGSFFTCEVILGKIFSIYPILIVKLNIIMFILRWTEMKMWKQTHQIHTKKKIFFQRILENFLWKRFYFVLLAKNIKKCQIQSYKILFSENFVPQFEIYIEIPFIAI